MNDTPHCPSCHRTLDRIDHHAIEHLILEDNIYRPVHVGDGMPDADYGVATETDLRCGYCAESVPRPVREYFYRRWGHLMDAAKRQC